MGNGRIIHRNKTESGHRLLNKGYRKKKKNVRCRSISRLGQSKQDSYIVYISEVWWRWSGRTTYGV